jgi:hypothetical protein
MTHWRMRREPNFPSPVVIRNTEYYYEDELEAYEERCRRRPAAAARPRKTASTTEATAE